MPTAISVANFQTAMGEVYDALSADNYTSAKKWLVLAEAQLNGLLVDETTSEGTTDKLRKNLEAMRKAIVAAQASSSAGRFEKINRLIP